MTDLSAPSGDEAPLVIAIDGPAGSGKSTVAKAVARRVGIDYLDTGAMYRAVAWAAMNAGIDLTQTDAKTDELVGAVARGIELEMTTDTITVNGEDASGAIRSPEVTRMVSRVAATPAVRDELRDRQRRFAVAKGGVVMEGRDIGTVVFPDAPVKVYLTATIAERARRRAIQSGADPAAVEAEMRRRDELDSSREYAPMKQADDATELDTTALSIEEVAEAIAAMVPGSADERESVNG